MPLVYVPLGTPPRQVDDFKGDCERSVKGALHFHPESTRIISKDELAHIKEHHRDFGNRLVVIDANMAPTKVVKAEEKPEKPMTTRQKQLAGQKVSRAPSAPQPKASYNFSSSEESVISSTEEPKKSKHK